MLEPFPMFFLSYLSILLESTSFLFTHLVGCLYNDSRAYINIRLSCIHLLFAASTIVAGQPLRTDSSRSSCIAVLE